LENGKALWEKKKKKNEKRLDQHEFVFEVAL